MKNRILSPSNDKFRFCSVKNKQGKKHAEIQRLNPREMAKAEWNHREFCLTH